jgi:general secretion pathway protein H
MLVQSGDRTGGAAGVTELEKELLADAEAIVEGPHAPRAEFAPVKKLLGFQDPETGLAIRKLGEDIYFKQVEVGHQDEPVVEERAYIYFWPGGQTEVAAVQLQKGNVDEVDDRDVSTVLVSPLTGKVSVKSGPIDMPKPTKDGDISEREDSG